ncbi:Ig-like domain repeat protein [Methanosphaera sp. ISO3-F5]|uniref:Ig-like domain repeat protein n=1 Tax=Methanosphaera sp. ISO3-F5 TaxID=1452353 RepID=UPI002B25F0CC|nr:Ig-like domain repeat protein [Methanosphaera sp. ISO3-F5]WQH63535.1 Ig-like domain repeat protein [Methanosphaera sp. ISO3-F5]
MDVINKRFNFLFILLIILLFASVVSASSDNIANSTSDDKIIKNDNSIEDNIQEKTINKQSNVLNKTKEAQTSNKHKTTTSLRTYTNGSHIIMNSTVKSSIKVNEGHVIFKLDGVTLKNKGNNIKVNVVNSRAVLAVSVSEYKALYSKSEAVYSGSDNFVNSRKQIRNTELFTHNTTTSLRTYSNATHIIMDATINSDIPVYNGYVIYKLNKKTLKNKNDNTIKVDVRDSKAVLALPISEHRRVYSNAEAVYSGSALYSKSRTLNDNTLNFKLNPRISVTANQSSYYPGENIGLKITILSDETNNFNNGKVAIKVNGVTLKDENKKSIVYRIKGDSVDVSVPVPKGLKYNHMNITVLSEGSNYNDVKSVNKINLNPLDTKIVVDNYVIDNNNDFIINANIKDKYGYNVIGKRFMDFLVDGNKVRINGKSKVYVIMNGKVDLQVPLDQYKKGSHTIQLRLRSDSAYASSSSTLYTINLREKYDSNIIIDTPQKAKADSQTKLRIYVTYDDQSIPKTVNDGNIVLKINGQSLSSKVTYGKAIISYKLPSKTGEYTITAKYEGTGDLKDSSSNKVITVTSGSISSSESAILGNKDPKNERISFTNGIPNLVYMTNYVWADEDATYTLTKSQLEEVFKQDSYSLYLNGHVSKYVAFKTANESDVYHVLKREKWNVIEKAANKVRVSSSKGTLPNTLTVNLKGKRYTYGEARAIQSTEYTCGPTAASVCTQTLRNYVNEHTLATEFHTYDYRGTYASYIDGAMRKHNMKAVYYYKNNFDSALTKVANGGYTFIFYGVNHYVSILDVSKDKSKVLVSNSYGNYDMGGGKIPNGWVTLSYMKSRFSSDSFAGLLVSLDYSLSSSTKTIVNNLYNNFGSNWNRQNTNEELNV